MCSRSPSATASRRSRSACLTVSIERPIAPERQNSPTIACASMFGEMYVLTACFVIAAIRSSGPIR